MASSKKLLDRRTITVATISVLTGLGGFALAVALSGQQVFGQKSSFACQLQPDTPGGNEVWTVTYRHEKEVKPWLKMVEGLPEDLSPKERCKEIAQRLEVYHQEGLKSLTYLENPGQPQKEYYVCVKTKASYSNCILLTSLKPGSDPGTTFQAMTAPLTGSKSTKSQTYKQRIGKGTSVSYTSKDPTIKLKSHLAEGAP